PRRPVRNVSIWVGRLPGTSPTGLPASTSAPGLLASASLSAICHPPNECLAPLLQGTKKVHASAPRRKRDFSLPCPGQLFLGRFIVPLVRLVKDMFWLRTAATSIGPVIAASRP